MKVPILMLSGKAQSGKDTVADILVKYHGAVKIAQADPMKRLAQTLFGFSDEALWGPSERRNEFVDLSDHRWVRSEVDTWLEEVLPGARNGDPYRLLKIWLESLPVPVTARHILQTLGTEWGRAFSKNMWVDLALDTARQILEGAVYNRTTGLAPVGIPTDVSNLVVMTDGRFRNEILAVRAAGGVTVKIVTPGAGLKGSAAEHASETEQDSIPDAWFDAFLWNGKKGLKSLTKTVANMMTDLRQKPLQCNTAAWEAYLGE